MSFFGGVTGKEGASDGGWRGAFTWHTKVRRVQYKLGSLFEYGVDTMFPLALAQNPLLFHE